MLEQRRKALLRVCHQKTPSAGMVEVVTMCCSCKAYKPQDGKDEGKEYNVEAELFEVVKTGDDSKVRLRHHLNCAQSDDFCAENGLLNSHGNPHLERIIS
jgi:hypothetical protein